MAFDPQQCRVLLVGKLLARLEPFLKSKGYTLSLAEESGTKAVELLAEQSFHLVLFELNLRDIELREFFQAARGNQRDASFILLATPNEAEMIVSALVLGADAYVPLPPDEDELFQVLERHGVAALQRKQANPNAQPGVSERVKKLEEELAGQKAQLEDLEEQRGLFEAETVRLRKELDAAKKAADTAKSTPQVPEGHTVIESAALEELESKATFIEFLESENDEIKKERDSLVAKLRELGLSDDAPDDVADEFDEPTGAVAIDDEALKTGLPKEAASDAVVLADDDDDDDDEALLIDDGDSEEVDLSAVEAIASKPAPASAKPPAPKAVPAAVDDADDDDEEVDFDGLGLDDESEEIDLAALEAMVEKAPAKGAPAAKVPAAKVPAPISPAPVSRASPKPVPPPSNDDDSEDDTGFEDVNTDALLKLVEDISSSDGSPSADDLEELLAAIDDD